MVASVPFLQIAKTLYGKNVELSLALQYAIKNPQAKICYNGKTWSYDPASVSLSRWERFLHCLKMCFSKDYRLNFEKGVQVLDLAKNEYNTQISKADSLRAAFINKWQPKVDACQKEIAQLKSQRGFRLENEIKQEVKTVKATLRKIRANIEDYIDEKTSRDLIPIESNPPLIPIENNPEY